MGEVVVAVEGMTRIVVGTLFVVMMKVVAMVEVVGTVVAVVVVFVAMALLV